MAHVCGYSDFPRFLENMAFFFWEEGMKSYWRSNELLYWQTAAEGAD